MRTRRRLKKWVKFTLLLIFMLILGYIFSLMIENYSNLLNNCDSVKGYTCNIFGK